VNEWLQSDKEFAQLYTRYAQSIYHLCRSYLNDGEIAKDLLQETFICVWKNRSKFRGESSIETWIYRIAINTCLGHIRDTKRKGITVSDVSPLTEKADDAVSEEEHAINILYQTIQQLSETDRLIIGMVLQEVPYDQIAEAMAIQEVNLRVKIHRIKKQLAGIHKALQNH
jgi:RNA polymerase sigma factor (sigma-70 family)